jgi:hypothetical protein
MKSIIRRVLKENRFIVTAHNMLAVENDKTAKQYGIDPDTWYLGTQILYYWVWKKSASADGCMIEGSPEFNVLAKKLAIINYDNYDDDNYNMYCDIINQYYDLDNFELLSNVEYIYAYLDRFVSVAILENYQQGEDGVDVDYELYLRNPDTIRVGYEFNDWDENGEIGTHIDDLVQELYNIFHRGKVQIETLVHNWTANKFATDQYHEV